MPHRRPRILEFVLLGAGLLLVIQYAWIMDDAFVYFRYADNLLFARRGLVYNAGEFVEGYSSPLWMLTCVVLRGLGLDWWTTTRLLGGLSFAAFWALFVRLDRELAPPDTASVPLPLLLLVPNYAVLCSFTSGLETPFVQVLAAAFALAVVRPDLRWLEIMVGFAPMVRHELVLPLLIQVAWSRFATRRWPLATLATTALTLGGWLVFRVGYYADLFPNTFYLKDEWMPWQGLAYLHDTLVPYSWHIILPLAGIGFVVLARRDQVAATGATAALPLHLAQRAVMLLMALAVTAYVVKIGGDPRHYRYLAFPLCLSVAATAGLPAHILARSRSTLPRPLVATVAILLAVAVGACYPRQLDRHPLLGPRPDQPLSAAPGDAGVTPYHRTVDLINDAAVHRHRKDFGCPPWGSCPRLDMRAAYRAAGPAHDGILVVYGCGTIYVNPRQRAVHSLGLTDPFLARTRMPAERPAHKFGLIPLAKDLRSLIEATGNEPHVGMFREAAESGRAPAWVLGNLDTLTTLARKAYNRGDWLENLRLALTFPPKIDPTRSHPGE